MVRLLRFLETVLIGTIGGIVFYHFHFPLPFILGSLVFVTLWQGSTGRTCSIPEPAVDTAFIILGIHFGLSFTLDTFKTVGTYFIPFLFLTILLIFTSILIGLWIAKKIPLDPVTSAFACVPGGLTEMTLASKDLGGNASYVAIFQTIRLITVIFLIPLVLTRIFPVVKQALAASVSETDPVFSLFYFLYFIPACCGFLMKKRVPAGIIIGALGITALMNLTALPLPEIPSILTALAQIVFGAYLGRRITFQELKKAGKYGIYYFFASLAIIAVSLFSGLVFGFFTSLNMQTALLTTAPGGLFEMVVTAVSINGDPAIVSSLQFIRIIIIVTVVPSLLKWYFMKYSVLQNNGGKMLIKSKDKRG